MITNVPLSMTMKFYVPRQECNTIQVPRTESVPEQKCHQVPEEKCETKFEQECRTEYEQKCETKYEQECETKYEQECSTHYEQVLIYVCILLYFPFTINKKLWARCKIVDN